MKPDDHLKRQTIHVRHTYKTKDDFLHWLRKRNALQKPAAEEQITQPTREMARALMIWSDDGGSPA
ncbi:MAG: hypothetical protein IAE79_13080 [Anaerolinea sp.]|nr:hypothetical protein [Anaerolinea sp.]